MTLRPAARYLSDALSESEKPEPSEPNDAGEAVADADAETVDTEAIAQRFRDEISAKRAADQGAARSLARDLLALVPLFVCAALHLYALTGAAMGRAEFLERVDLDRVPWALAAVLASLVVAGVLAIREAERERLFWLALVLTIGLVVLHGWVLFQAPDDRALYVVLRGRLATPWVLAAYLVGLAGFSIHVMESVASLGRRARADLSSAAGVVGMMTAAVFFVIAVNAIAPFARGQAFFFRGDHEERGAPQETGESMTVVDSSAPQTGETE